MSRTDILEERVSIRGGGAPLDGVFAYPIAHAARHAALLVGPHPLLGGSLQNNVVRAVARGMAEAGRGTLRFAYSAGGATAEAVSQFWATGHAPDDPDRAHDARAALGWLVEQLPGALILVGYSFGAALLADLLGERVELAVLIGATFNQHSYESLATTAIPKLVIAADNDFATPLATTEAWVAAAHPPTRLVVIPSAEHFYRGCEERLVDEILRGASA